MGGLPARIVIAGTAIALCGALVAIGMGTRAFRRRGSPRRAIVAAAALAFPLALVLGFGIEASRFTPAAGVDSATAVAEFRADLAVRRFTGWSGLLLALPLGAASGLWAGIAAARRTRRAGERARLSAQAAGDPDAGQAVASTLDRSRSPETGGAIGILAGLSLAGLPSVGLLLYTSALDQALIDLIHLDRPAAAVFLRMALHDASRPLLATSIAGGLGAAVAAILFGTAIHAASSRRRNLALATRLLEARGASPAARAAVTSALAATGKPGPLAPALLALTFLVLAVAALLAAASVGPAEAPPPEEGLAGARPSFPQVLHGRELRRFAGLAYSDAMRVLELPAEVAIGGVEARADGLARDSERAAKEAERLILALLRGEPLPPKAPRTMPVPRIRAA